MIGSIAIDSWLPDAAGLDEFDEAEVASGLAQMALRMLGS